METQKQIILNMLLDKSFVCVTEMMAAFIPDYRRRLCDLKKDGYQLEGRPCQQHNHKSKILKEWRIVEPPVTQNSAPTGELVEIPIKGYIENEKVVFSPNFQQALL